MKILIIGADGQLGTDLCKVIPKEDQIPLTVKDLDITDRERTASVLQRYSPQIVINTAAYNRVDDCEEHEAEAFAVNAVGVKHVAQACREVGAALVHISTDYVFDGDKKTPYLETDPPNPCSVYGISKLAGEFCVKYLLEKYFIIRSAGLYGMAGCMGKGGGNFVENMIRQAETRPELKAVTDEVLSPTYTLDLAKKIYALIKTKNYGLYHVVNHGECSWYDLTVKIFELLGKKVKVSRAVSSEFSAGGGSAFGGKTKARRPKYSVLKNEKLAELGMDDMRPWAEALKAYLAEKR